MLRHERCPFCWSMINLAPQSNKRGCFICCLGCQATGPVKHSYDQAWEAWDNRPQKENPIARQKRIRDAKSSL